MDDIWRDWTELLYPKISICWNNWKYSRYVGVHRQGVSSGMSRCTLSEIREKSQISQINCRSLSCSIQLVLSVYSQNIFFLSIVWSRIDYSASCCSHNANLFHYSRATQSVTRSVQHSVNCPPIHFILLRGPLPNQCLSPCCCPYQDIIHFVIYVLQYLCVLSSLMSRRGCRPSRSHHVNLDRGSAWSTKATSFPTAYQTSDTSPLHPFHSTKSRGKRR